MLPRFLSSIRLRRACRVLLLCLAAAVGAGATGGALLWWDVSGAVPVQRGLLTVLAADGSTIAEQPLPGGYALSQPMPSPVFTRMLLRAEDARYYQHHGSDVRAKLHVLALAVEQGRLVSGGSTLTEQLAKNRYWPHEPRTVLQKLREAAMAARLEATHSKDELLRMYVQHAYYGRGIWGLEAAAQHYYGTSSSLLDAHQSTVLLALLQRPALADAPTEQLAARLPLVARRSGYAAELARAQKEEQPEQNTTETNITEQEANRATHRKAALSPTAAISSSERSSKRVSEEPQAPSETFLEISSPSPLGRGPGGGGITLSTAESPTAELAPEAALALARGLGWRAPVFPAATAPQYTAAVLAALPQLPSGHTVVHTPLDATLQRQWQARMQQELGRLRGKNVGSSAGLAVDARTGRVLALAQAGEPGGDLTLAPRSTGSIIKPFIYYLAHARGLEPAHLLPDTEASYTEGDTVYTPLNYNLREQGLMPAATALAQSSNIAAVRLYDMLGPTAVADGLRGFGLAYPQAPAHYGRALPLGAAPQTLRSMVAAAAALGTGSRPALQWVGSAQLPAGTPADALQPWLAAGWAPMHTGQQTARTGDDAPAEADDAISLAAPGTPHYAIPGSGAATRARWAVWSSLSSDQLRGAAFGRGGVLATPFPAAGKTGTTTNWGDNWALGWGQAVAWGVWVGNRDNSPMADVSGVTGAGPLWHAGAQLLQQHGYAADNALAEPAGTGTADICLREDTAGACTAWAAVPAWQLAGQQVHGSGSVCSGWLWRPTSPADADRLQEMHDIRIVPCASDGTAPAAPTPADTGAKATAAKPLQILRPTPGSTLLLQAGYAPGLQAAPLRASAPGLWQLQRCADTTAAEPTQCTQWIDEPTPTQASASLAAPLQPGLWQARITDDAHASASTWYTVQQGS